jgi:hypothetical protein
MKRSNIKNDVFPIIGIINNAMTSSSHETNVIVGSILLYDDIVAGNYLLVNDKFYKILSIKPSYGGTSYRIGKYQKSSKADYREGNYGFVVEGLDIELIATSDEGYPSVYIYNEAGVRDVKLSNILEECS